MNLMNIVFYHDILTLEKDSENGNILYIHWFPWNDADNSRKYVKVATRHTSTIGRNKCYKTVSKLICSSCNLLFFVFFKLCYLPSLLKAPLGMKCMEERERKKLLVLINPKSGSGAASSIFADISFIFDLAHIEYEKICMYNRFLPFHRGNPNFYHLFSIRFG